MRVLILLVIAISGIIIGYIITKPDEKPLKIYNPVDVEEELVDEDLVRKGFGHKIGQFEFTDQLGKPYGSKDLKGKTYVVEYFFTTCGTICPRMNAQMQRVHKVYKDNPNFEIISLTVDAKTDTVEQMYRYAEGHGADHSAWHFLTGDQAELYKLARRSFFVLKPAETRNQGDVGSDFIHTQYFVLIDKQARIRGYYDGTSEKEVGKLIKDIDFLFQEK